MRQSLRLRVSAVLPLLLLARPLSAQRGRMVLVPAVVAQDPQPVPFAFNDTLAVRLDANSLSRRERLQVRVFTGTKRDVLAKQPRNGCVEFLTRLYSVGPGIGSAVEVTQLNGSWLEPAGSRTSPFDDGRWVLVFEESGVSDLVLRLDPHDVSRYFAHAIEVTVSKAGYTPNDVPAAVAAVLAAGRSGYPTPVAPLGRATACVRPREPSR
jgi:hypothetical protein